MGRYWSHGGGNFLDFSLGNIVFSENHGFPKKTSQQPFWYDLGYIPMAKKRSSGEAFGDQVGVRKGEQKRCEKEPRLDLVFGGGGADCPRSL